MRSPVVLLLACLALPTSALAGAPQPLLGKPGKLLLEEKFESDALPAGWTRNNGELAVRAGSLRVSERAADQHVAAFRKALPLQDCLIQVDVKLEGANVFHLGFDPAPGALQKKGHLFSLIITPDGWQITEHLDKNDPKSKNNVRAKSATKFPSGEWFTLQLEVKGTEVVAQVAGRPALRASGKDFQVKKPGLVFRVGGKGEHAALVDNVRVWALE